MIDPADLVVEVSLMIGSAFLGSYLTYIFAIRQSMKDRIVTERVKLYKPLVDLMNSLTETHDPDEWKELSKKANQIYNELLLFAPDTIVDSFLNVMKNIRKGASAAPIVDFILALRKEILGKTQITSQSVSSIEIRP